MKNRSIKHILLLLVTLSSLLLISCWDYNEVEKRGYVLGIGIDKAFPSPKGYEEDKLHMDEKDMEIYELQKGSPKYAFTIQIPVLPKAQIKPLGAGEGASNESRAWDLTLLAESFFEANREFSTRLDYAPFYEHLQVIIINEDVARKSIIPPLDMLLRDPASRRRTKVFITPEESHKILDVVPRIDDYASTYLAQLPTNASKTSRMAHITDLGKVSESLHNNIDFVLPRVISTKDEIKNAGLAVFKGDKMVGWLGEVHTIYTKWIRDAIEGGIILIKAPDDPNIIITLEIKKAKSKVRPVIESNIKMHIESSATVNIAEVSETDYQNIFKKDFIKNIENQAEKEVKKNIEDTVKYVQQELGADIFHFNLMMKGFAPEKWEDVKDNWHQEFKNLEVDVDVNIKVKYSGTIK